MKRFEEPRYVWEQKNWPSFFWETDALLKPLSQARLAQGRLHQALRSLGFQSIRESQATVLIEEAVTTAAIEGESLDRQTVRSSVARRLGLPTAGLPQPHQSIEGLVDVLQDATVGHKEKLTLKRLQSWQAALFPTGYSGLHKIRVGAWRGKQPMRVVSGPMGREKVHFEAPPFHRIPKEMNQFIRWWNKDSTSLDGLLRAGMAHFYFVTIHPFEDGNGRVARALTDMALAQDEKMDKRFYSVSARIMADRADYYRILETCQKGTLDIGLWLRWFLGCVARALHDSEKLLAKSLWKDRFWQRHGGLSLSPRQRKVLNRLLDAGPQGFEGGLTTRKYRGMTKASRVTAFREISDLVQKKILRPQKGRGRSMSYELKWP